MPGKMITPIKVIGDHIKASVEAKMKVIINTFCYVGEQCIVEARDNGDYTDQTGNLRSSIGYAVLWNGKIIQKECADKVKNGDEGTSKGEKFLSDRIKKVQKKGVVLIVTAGMNYAEYVEAKGYNVLSSAELKAGPLIKSILTQIGFKVK
ncbi:MAG: hypothetical protein J6U85_03720 [Bacteroidales bacterium]|nr:hypothetical protein [Bacteroidales bacterium]